MNLQIFYSRKILALPAVLVILPCDILVTALDTLHLEQQYAVVSKKLHGRTSILLNSEFEALISATPQWTIFF